MVIPQDIIEETKRYAFINTETQGGERGKGGGVLEACFQNMTPVFLLIKISHEQPYGVVLH